ncbi:MAG: hypothetical protein KI792_08155 [Alphaproteobacteria bacterium]|nr:hypothetical protein [Alphaproteobacteria bacterium SS10]
MSSLEERPTAEQLGQEDADRPFDGEWVKSRRSGNWAILAVLVGIGLMFYFITIIRIEEGAKAREQAEARAAAEQALVESSITQRERNADDVVLTPALEAIAEDAAAAVEGAENSGEAAQ